MASSTSEGPVPTVGGPVALTADDFDAVLRLLARVSAADDLADFARRTCVELLGLLPALSVSYNEIDRRATRASAVIVPDPGPEWFAEYQPPFEQHMHDNPLIRAFLAERDLAPTTWLDLDPERAFEQTELFRAFYAPNDIRSQLAFTVPSLTGIIVAVAINRDGRDFDARERALLAALRPVLGNAYRLVRRNERDLLPPEVDPGLVVDLPGAVEAGLTPRQAEVAAAITTGATTAQIARALDLAPGTVRKHTEAIYAALGVHSRAAATARLLRGGSATVVTDPPVA